MSDDGAAVKENDKEGVVVVAVGTAGTAPPKLKAEAAEVMAAVFPKAGAAEVVARVAPKAGAGVAPKPNGVAEAAGAEEVAMNLIG